MSCRLKLSVALTAFTLGLPWAASAGTAARAAEAAAPAPLSGAHPSRSAVVDAPDSASKSGVRQVLCHGLPATIVGTGGSNELVGTGHRDVIAGGGGADTISGQGDADIICGDGGADVVNGGSGRDTIYGGSGGDVLEGGPSPDRLYGGAYNDLCLGESREHQHHLGCEEHLDPFGNFVSAPPTRSPRSAAVQPARVLRTPSGARPRMDEAGYLQVPSVADCYRTNSSRYIELGRVIFQTYYTNPGTIALRPIYAALVNGGYSTATAARNWQLYQAPADFETYYVDMGTADQPTSSTATIWGFEAWWWNGTQWANHTTAAYGAYNWVGYLGVVGAANSAVCT